MDARIMPAAVLGLKEGCVGAIGSAFPPTASWSLARVPKGPLPRNARVCRSRNTHSLSTR